MTRVSVVIPTFNRNDLLFGRSLDSVLRQTHRDLEVHVVCDGMEREERADLNTRLALRHDPRVKLWDIPRQTYPEDPGQRWMVLGLNARNHGLDQAQGDWIAPLDDDDEWTLTHVEDLLRVAQQAEVDFAYGKSVAFGQSGGVIGHYGNWPPGHFQFCDGAQLYRNGLGYRYDPGCIERGLPEDGDLWDRMVAGGVRFTFLEKVVHYYYPNPR